MTSQTLSTVAEVCGGSPSRCACLDGQRLTVNPRRLAYPPPSVTDDTLSFTCTSGWAASLQQKCPNSGRPSPLRRAASNGGDRIFRRRMEYPLL